MAIPHAIPGKAIDVGPLGDSLPGAQTVALFKTAELEVMRLILPAGKSLPQHKVPGEITIQCIEGKIEVNADGSIELLGAGQMLYLSGGAMHSLRGIEDASALVTIVLRK